MHPVFSRNLYFVKEHARVFKASNHYDVLDPTSKEVILQCREPSLGALTKVLRFTQFKRLTPFAISLQTPDGKPILRITRGVSLLLSKVSVFNERDEYLGGFQQRFFSIGGAFTIKDAQGQPVCELRGKWTGWDFRFLAGQHEFARVSKKWAGVGKEMFTSADNYMLQIDESVPQDSPARPLILAAVMCIDMVLKE